MDHNQYIARARAAGEAARRRRARALAQEVGSFVSGGIMVFTGLLLAVAYCVLKHQMQI